MSCKNGHSFHSNVIYKYACLKSWGQHILKDKQESHSTFLEDYYMQQTRKLEDRVGEMLIKTKMRKHGLKT